VKISGYGYANAGTVSGDFAIGTDATGVRSVSGVGGLPGANGGSATVSVGMTRHLYWTFGSVSVSDPGAGIRLTGRRVLGPPMAKFGNTVTVSGSWFTFSWRAGFKPYTITATITDNG
jgi:hypothetical protein